MMTPKFRKYLTETSPGQYHLKGTVNVYKKKVPDRMGTYRVKLHYVRPGWTFVDELGELFARPWHYKEYTKDFKRDMPSAVGIVAIMAGFAVLSLFFVYDSRRLELLEK